MICEKFREEMWKKKKRNLGEFSSNLCQGLAARALAPSRHTVQSHYHLVIMHIMYIVNIISNMHSH